MVIHLGLLPLMAVVMGAKPSATVMMAIEVVDAPKVEAIKKVEVATPAPPPPKPKTETITAPKLLSKPTIFDSPRAAANNKAQIKEPEKPPEEAPKIASLPESAGGVKASLSKSGEAEGSASGAGNLFGHGDVAVVGGGGTAGGGGGRGNAGLGQGAKGDGSGGGGSGDAVTAIARPLGGYQVRPRYPESARLAGVQGTTLLKLRVLENGRVGEVVVEQSAGHRDLDNAAAEAVKKWLFEPARQGKDPLAVWVILPVKFELQR